MADQTPVDKEVSYLDEVKQVRDDIIKEKEELAKIRDDIKKLKTEDILSGKAPSVSPEVPVEEDPKAYLDRILKNK